MDTMPRWWIARNIIRHRRGFSREKGTKWLPVSKELTTIKQLYDSTRNDLFRRILYYSTMNNDEFKKAVDDMRLRDRKYYMLDDKTAIDVETDYLRFLKDELGITDMF